MRPMADWYDNDAFWEETGPALFTEERWQAAVPEVQQILELVKVPPGATVLDMGCGVGRHAIEFARHGYRVTGVDRTAKYLREAKNKAGEQGLDVEWVEADMRRFRRDGAFDLAVSMLTSFGYFPNAADDRRVAENLFASLQPGGVFVMDLMGKEVLARQFRRQDWQEQPDGTMLLEQRSVKDGWGTLEMRWIVIRGEDIRQHRFELRLYSAAELQALLEGIGFVDVTAYGSVKGTPYDDNAERLVLAAWKAPSPPKPS